MPPLLCYAHLRVFYIEKRCFYGERQTKKQTKQAKKKTSTLLEQTQQRLGEMARFGESKHESKQKYREIRNAERNHLRDSTAPKDWKGETVADVLAQQNLPQQVRTFLHHVQALHPELQQMEQAFRFKQGYLAECREKGLSASTLSAYDKALDRFQNPPRTPKKSELTPYYQGEIFSYRTMEKYCSDTNIFLNWCLREGNKAENLDNLEKFVTDYLVDCQNRGLSDSTIKGYDAALCKLYRHECRHYMDLAKRHCADFVKNRSVPSDYDVDKGQNRQVMEVIRSSGLRKNELMRICPEKFTQEKGVDGVTRYFVQVDPQIGKGGRGRRVECLDRTGYEYAQKSLSYGRKTLFHKESYPEQMNHWYRSDFARAVYAKTVASLPPPEKKDLYFCRGAKKGLVYDRRALSEVAVRLGHGATRLSLAVNNYLFPRDEECGW